MRRLVVMLGAIGWILSLNAQTLRGLYNVNLFPELENSAYNRQKSAGVVTFFGNIPNNEMRSDFYTLGANAILHKKKSVAVAANYNLVGEHLMMYNNIKLSYIYHLDVVEDLSADFGITMGALNPSINMEKVIATDEFDPALILLSESKLWYLDAAASAVFSYKNQWKFGFSMNRFPSRTVEVDYSSFLHLPRKLHANVNYNFGETGSKVTNGLTAGIWYTRYDSISRWNIAVSKSLNNQVALNLGYITNPKTFHVGLQILFGNNRIGYSAGLNQQSKLFGNGTEVILEANLSKKELSKPNSNQTESEYGRVEEDSSLYTDFPDQIEYVFLSDTSTQEKVSVYSPSPSDFIVNIERWDDLKKIRMGHDTAKIILKSVKNEVFKPGYYLMVKMSPSELTIDDEIKRLFTLGTVSYKLYDPKMNVFYQFVDWSMDEVESSKQLQYFDKEFKFLWIKTFK